MAAEATDMQVRLAAAVSWKNHLKFHWSHKDDDAGLKAEAPFVIPDAEKEAVKSGGLVGIMLAAPPLVQAQVYFIVWLCMRMSLHAQPQRTCHAL